MRTSHIQLTAIRHAFNNIKVMKSAFTEKGAIIADKINTALHSKAGAVNELDWNAKLSMKTAQALDAPSFNPKKRVGGTGLDIPIEISVFRERAWNTGTFNKMCS